MGADRARCEAGAQGRPTGGAVLAAAMLAALAGCGGSPQTHTNGSAASKATATRSSGAAAATPSSTSATASASAGSGNTVSASAAGVSATLLAGTHAPKVNANWPIHITVSRAGRPEKASVVYEFLLGGQVVAHRSHSVFRGHFSDVFQWPSSAVGYPLTFRAVIASGAATINLDYPVQVHT